MRALVLLGASLTALLPGSVSASAQTSSNRPVASKADKAFKMGFVLYTEGFEPLGPTLWAGRP